MIGYLGRLGVALLATAACAGCSVDTFTYTVDRYGNVTGNQVHLGCHDTYEVFDRPDAGTLMVVTNPLNESLGAFCDSGSAVLPKPERLRRAADLYLEETTDRPACRIYRTSEITPVHTEFAYRCPAPPRAPARRGRG